jgi:hypothetical protein
VEGNPFLFVVIAKLHHSQGAPASQQVILLPGLSISTVWQAPILLSPLQSTAIASVYTLLLQLLVFPACLLALYRHRVGGLDLHSVRAHMLEQSTEVGCACSCAGVGILFSEGESG